MRIGNVEGSPKEIRDLFEDHGLPLENYLGKPEQPLNHRWIIIPSCLFIISLLMLSIFQNADSLIKNIIFLSGCSGMLWLSVSTQIRFKSGWATTIVITLGILLLLVALGVISPSEIPKYYKEMRSN